MKNIILIFVGFIVSAGAVANLTPEELKEAFNNWEYEIKKIDPKRKKKLESQFSSWSGSHRKLEQYIKKQLNDSDSYQHIETRYSPNLNPMQVGTKFRSKNAYGALMINHVLAEVSDKGEVIRILKWQ